MVEVVVEVGLGLDEPERDALCQLEVRLALAPPLDLEVVGQLSKRALEVADAQRDVLERPTFPRSVGREECQLPAACIGADERERVRPVDHVHPEVADGEIRDGIAVGEPVGDVVEGLRVHDRRVPRRAAIIRSARSGRCSRPRISA